MFVWHCERFQPPKRQNKKKGDYTLKDVMQSVQEQQQQQKAPNKELWQEKQWSCISRIWKMTHRFSISQQEIRYMIFRVICVQGWLSLDTLCRSICLWVLWEFTEIVLTSARCEYFFYFFLRLTINETMTKKVEHKQKHQLLRQVNTHKLSFFQPRHFCSFDSYVPLSEEVLNVFG